MTGATQRNPPAPRLFCARMIMVGFGSGCKIAATAGRSAAIAVAAI